MLVAGIDEAGRGAALGPLVLGIAVVKKATEETLSDIGVKDSKLLSPRQRETIFELLPVHLAEFAVFSFEPGELNSLMGRFSLNEIEAMGCARLIDGLKQKPDWVILDSPDVDAKRFAVRVKSYLSQSIDIKSEHKADFNYPVVGAASILAKVTRDRAIVDLGKKHGDFGSGYPSDPFTVAFLEKYVSKHKALPLFARSKWANNQALINRMNQKSLGDYH